MKSIVKFFLFKVLNFVSLFICKQKELDLNDSDIFILLKKPLGLGDLVMLSPFIKLIEKNYENNIFIVSEYDKFIDFERVKWVKPDEIDLKSGFVISPTLALTHFKYIFQAKYFIGYFTSNKLISNISRRSFEYDPKTEHYLAKTFPILDILQIKYEKEEFEYPSLISQDVKENFENYILITPYSNWLERQYPKEKYIELINLLLDEYPYKIVVNGSSSETEISFNKEVVEVCNNDRIINVTGETTVLQMNHLIKNCRLFIGNDSGPANIAYLTAPKSLVFFGSVYYENRLPLNSYLKQNIIALDDRSSCKYFPCYDGYNKPNCHNSQKYSCLSGININKQILEKLLD